MGKPKPNLAGVLDDLPQPIREAPAAAKPTKEAPHQGGTVLVGANLSPSYARNLALLSAETGRSKKQLLQEALDMLFVKAGGPNLR